MHKEFHREHILFSMSFKELSETSILQEFLFQHNCLFVFHLSCREFGQSLQRAMSVYTAATWLGWELYHFSIYPVRRQRV